MREAQVGPPSVSGPLFNRVSSNPHAPAICNFRGGLHKFWWSPTWVCRGSWDRRQQHLQWQQLRRHPHLAPSPVAAAMQPRPLQAPRSMAAARQPQATAVVQQGSAAPRLKIPRTLCWGRAAPLPQREPEVKRALLWMLRWGDSAAQRPQVPQVPCRGHSWGSALPLGEAKLQP